MSKTRQKTVISGSFMGQKQSVLCLLADEPPMERGCVSSIAIAKEDVKAQPQHVAGTQGDGNKVNAFHPSSFILAPNRVQRHAGHAGGRRPIIFRSGRTTTSTPAGFRSRPTPARRNRAEHVAHRRQKFPGAGRGSLRSGFFPRCRGNFSPL